MAKKSSKTPPKSPSPDSSQESATGPAVEASRSEAELSPSADEGHPPAEGRTAGSGEDDIDAELSGPVRTDVERPGARGSAIEESIDDDFPVGEPRPFEAFGRGSSRVPSPRSSPLPNVPTREAAPTRREIDAVDGSAAGDAPAGRGSDSPASDPPGADEAASSPQRAPRTPIGRFGKTELMALAGIAVVGLVAAALFFKYLYAHPAQTVAVEVPRAFKLPLSGASARLVKAEVAWRDRVESDRTRPEEVVLPVVRLALDPAASSAGFIRVEFIDPEGKIRGDIATVTVEGGRFKDSGRGEKVGADGTEVSVAGTVGFESQALYATYLGDDEPRWTVRLREGADYSNGPWKLLGTARVANQKKN